MGSDPRETRSPKGGSTVDPEHPATRAGSPQAVATQTPITDHDDPRASHLPHLLALGVPALYWLASAPAIPDMGPGAERLLQALTLEPVDPLGTPVSALAGALLRLLPLGALGLRIGALHGLATAAACAGAAAFAVTCARTLGIRQVGVAVALSVGLQWIALARGPGMQAALHGESLALSHALLWWLLASLAQVCATSNPPHRSAWLRAGLLLGLLFAESQPVGLIGAVACASAVYLTGGSRRVSQSTVWLVLLGLAPSALFVMRPGTERLGAGVEALAPPGFGWAMPWIAPSPLADTPSLYAPGTGLLLATLLAALLALAAPGASRSPLRRQVSLLASVAAAVSLQLLAIDPRARAVAALAALLLPVAAVLGTLAPLACMGASPSRPARLGGGLLAVSGLALGFLSLQRSAIEEGTRPAAIGQLLARHSLRELPPRSVVVSASHGDAHLHAALTAEQHERPDIRRVFVPRLRNPDVVERLASHHPELSPLSRGLLLDGQLATSDLQSIAARRPLFLHPDLAQVFALAETLRPTGLLYEVMPDGVTDADERNGADAQAALYDSVLSELAETPAAAARAYLSERLRVDASYYEAFGDAQNAATAQSRMRRLIR